MVNPFDRMALKARIDRPRKKRDRDGFTIIDLLVLSILIFVLVFLGWLLLR
jgi:hypothetical protein